MTDDEQHTGLANGLGVSAGLVLMGMVGLVVGYTPIGLYFDTLPFLPELSTIADLYRYPTLQMVLATADVLLALECTAGAISALMLVVYATHLPRGYRGLGYISAAAALAVGAVCLINVATLWRPVYITHAVIKGIAVLSLGMLLAVIREVVLDMRRHPLSGGMALLFDDLRTRVLAGSATDGERAAYEALEQWGHTK
jgi:hypothetical protein